MKAKNDHQHVYDLCKQHMHAYVLAETTDGTQFDGIITGLDDEYVYFAVPVDPYSDAAYQGNDYRKFGYGYGFGNPWYGPGFYPGYGFGYGFGRPPRRFTRLILPLAALAAISTLPWY